MIVEVKKGDTFIPTWRGNDKRTSDDQIQVDYKFLNAGERKRYIHKEDTEVYGTGDESGYRMKLVQDSAGLTKAMVSAIRNLAVAVDGDITEIKTASDLYNIPLVPQALVTEIEQAMVDASPEVDVDPT